MREKMEDVLCIIVGAAWLSIAIPTELIASIIHRVRILLGTSPRDLN